MSRNKTSILLFSDDKEISSSVQKALSLVDDVCRRVCMGHDLTGKDANEARLTVSTNYGNRFAVGTYGDVAQSQVVDHIGGYGSHLKVAHPYILDEDAITCVSLNGVMRR